MLVPWREVFGAQAGAAATLTGLLFVALSFNFDHIIDDATMLGRAASGILMLAAPVVVAIVMLVPAPSVSGLGWVCVALAVILIGVLARIVLAGSHGPFGRPGGSLAELWARLILVLAGPAGVLTGGLTLTTAGPPGPYLIAAGATTCMIIGLGNAWVLLVEARRPAPRRF